MSSPLPAATPPTLPNEIINALDTLGATVLGGGTAADLTLATFLVGPRAAIAAVVELHAVVAVPLVGGEIDYLCRECTHLSDPEVLIALAEGSLTNATPATWAVWATKTAPYPCRTVRDIGAGLRLAPATPEVATDD